MSHNTYKVVIVGDTNTGKTSILNQYAFSQFSIGVPATIGVEVCHKEQDDKTHLCIWDTAGQERFQSVGSHLYRGAHAVMFVYDISSEQSFHGLERWWRQYCSYGNVQNSIAILVGNKLDLAPQVSTKQARAWAATRGICCEEISAKNKLQVHKAFSTLVHQMQSLPLLQTEKLQAKHHPTTDRCCTN